VKRKWVISDALVSGVQNAKGKEKNQAFKIREPYRKLK